MQRLIEVTKDLIKFKSTHDRPQEIMRCAQYVQDYLDSCGLSYSTFDHEGYRSIMVLPQPGYAPVLLMAHIDVVAASEGIFTPREEDGNLYGRGSLDDKYAVALSLVLAKNYFQKLKDQGKTQADMPFGVLITSDEEIGGHSGAEKALERINCDFCIALDGGNVNKIVTKEKGLLTLKLVTRGKAAHGSRPWLGENAIELLFQDYMKMKEFFSPQSEDTWGRTMNFSIIRAGESFNQVPGRAEGVFDIRYTEQDDPDRLFEQMQQAVKGELSVVRKEAVLMGDESPYLEKLLAVAKDAVTGFEHGASDARFMTVQGIDGIVWGADGDNSAHTEQEHLNMASAGRLYGLLEEYMERIGTGTGD